MPTSLNPKFSDYLDNLQKMGQIKANTRRNYAQYVKWITQYGFGTLNSQTLQDKDYVSALIKAVEKGFNNNPSPQRKYDWNHLRTADAKTLLNHYARFLHSEIGMLPRKASSGSSNKAWIFQANPKNFDVLPYVSKYDRIYWSVEYGRVRAKVAVGNEVFIWKAFDKGSGFAGVIAHGIVVEPPTDKTRVQFPKNLGKEFWIGKAVEKSRIKVGIELDRKALQAEDVLQRGRLATDIFFRDSQIIKVRNGAIFPLTTEQAKRLNKLWTVSAIEKTQKELEQTGEFDPSDEQDGKKKVNRSIALRRGGRKFRNTLIAAYNCRCAVTGTSLEDVLEAAHIIPYNGPSTNHPCNGLLLRSDIHALFDLGLLSIHPESFHIYCSKQIREETVYGELHGKMLRLPTSVSQRPSEKALRIHFDKREC